jgi:hypothetical protein
MRQYAAKLLLAWDPDPIANSRTTRLCEERIVRFEARSARLAVQRAITVGRRAELAYESGHRLSFVGVLQCMELDSSDPGEVWWEFRRHTDAQLRGGRLLPAGSELWVFQDRAATAPRGHKRSRKRAGATSSERAGGR